MYILQVHGSQPDAIQHNGMTNSEAELEKHTTLRVRSTASASCINYRVKGKTIQKPARTC